MSKNIVSQNLTFGQGSELVRALVRQGLNPQGAQHLIEDQNLARQVVNLAQGETTPWNRAAAIMGDRAIGINFAAKLGLKLSAAKKANYNQVPFSDAELEEAARQGYYLVAMPSVDLLDLRRAGQFFCDQDWYQKQDFARIKSRAGYHLLRELPGSTNKNWSEQLALQPTGFEVPQAVEMAYLAAAWLASGKGAAFPDWVRTCDEDSVEARLLVRIDVSWVGVYGSGDSYRNSDFAVASGQFRSLVS